MITVNDQTDAETYHSEHHGSAEITHELTVEARRNDRRGNACAAGQDAHRFLGRHAIADTKPVALDQGHSRRIGCVLAAADRIDLLRLLTRGYKAQNTIAV